MEKQTALDFLLTELDIAKLISRERLTMAAEVVRQAKEMEKQQIINAWEDVGADGVTTAEEYYNETFKNTNK
jgi:HEPN domain-containing protein